MFTKLKSHRRSQISDIKIGMIPLKRINSSSRSFLPVSRSAGFLLLLGTRGGVPVAIVVEAVEGVVRVIEHLSTCDSPGRSPAATVRRAAPLCHHALLSWLTLSLSLSSTSPLPPPPVPALGGLWTQHSATLKRLFSLIISGRFLNQICVCVPYFAAQSDPL